jgi:hypothetical protein
MPDLDSAGPLTPETWEADAERLAADGEFTAAGRCLLRASLLRLAATRRRPPRPGATNREYLRRFRQTPAVEPLEALVEVVDWHWFSGRPCGADDYGRCAAAHRAIAQWAGENAVADLA